MPQYEWCQFFNRQVFWMLSKCIELIVHKIALNAIQEDEEIDYLICVIWLGKTIENVRQF
jgi:hypothetical protein